MAHDVGDEAGNTGVQLGFQLHQPRGEFYCIHERRNWLLMLLRFFLHLKYAGAHCVLHADLDELAILGQPRRHGPHLQESQPGNLVVLLLFTTFRSELCS